MCEQLRTQCGQAIQKAESERETAQNETAGLRSALQRREVEMQESAKKIEEYWRCWVRQESTKAEEAKSERSAMSEQLLEEQNVLTRVRAAYSRLGEEAERGAERLARVTRQRDDAREEARELSSEIIALRVTAQDAGPREISPRSAAPSAGVTLPVGKRTVYSYPLQSGEHVPAPMPASAPVSVPAPPCIPECLSPRRDTITGRNLSATMLLNPPGPRSEEIAGGGLPPQRRSETIPPPTSFSFDPREQRGGRTAGKGSYIPSGVTENHPRLREEENERNPFLGSQSLEPETPVPSWNEGKGSRRMPTVMAAAAPEPEGGEERGWADPFRPRANGAADARPGVSGQQDFARRREAEVISAHPCRL